ncbi:MAG TPA: prealbumin-like fold domain-containing protein [Pyrinomonadaceae bacterium]|nr:prealbumin-like fold domain-containing protein [Pyrinomonadaceae bacterium]
MTANGAMLYAGHMNVTLRTLIVAAAILLSPSLAFACSCGPTVTVLEEYNRVEAVMIVRVTGVEKAKGFGINNIRSTKVVVEKVYKGDLRTGDEFSLPQGGGADCIWTFAASDVGTRYLFYLNSLKDSSRHWIASTCGRSGEIKYEREDLLYLDKMDQVRGKTRVSGKYSALGGAPGLEVANRKVRVVGQGKSYELTTDSDGVFEIYDLPPGDYRLEPEMPAGWKLEVGWLSNSVSAIPKLSTEKAVAFKLEPQKHASIDLPFIRATDAR